MRIGLKILAPPATIGVSAQGYRDIEFRSNLIEMERALQGPNW